MHIFVITLDVIIRMISHQNCFVCITMFFLLIFNGLMANVIDLRVLPPPIHLSNWQNKRVRIFHGQTNQLSRVNPALHVKNVFPFLWLIIIGAICSLVYVTLPGILPSKNILDADWARCFLIF